MLCVTWGPVWVNEWQQYAYERGVYEGAAILGGLIGMGTAISAKTWFCNPHGPEGSGCRGQNLDPNDPVCWLCGIDDETGEQVRPPRSLGVCSECNGTGVRLDDLDGPNRIGFYDCPKCKPARVEPRQCKESGGNDG